jgi:hypothetical protein
MRAIRFASAFASLAAAAAFTGWIIGAAQAAEPLNIRHG